MLEYAYIVVPARNPGQYSEDVLYYLTRGYEIISATATSEHVHYVLRGRA